MADPVLVHAGHAASRPQQGPNLGPLLCPKAAGVCVLIRTGSFKDSVSVLVQNRPEQTSQIQVPSLKEAVANKQGCDAPAQMEQIPVSPSEGRP